MTYLIVGLDLKTYAPWHGNVSADDTGTAKRIARVRAAAQGLDLVVAAVIGPNSAVVSDSAEEWANGIERRLTRTAAADAAPLKQGPPRLSTQERQSPSGPRISREAGHLMTDV